MKISKHDVVIYDDVKTFIKVRSLLKYSFGKFLYSSSM